MITQQLLDYIKQQLKQGISKEQIKDILLANGWQKNDIEEGFRKVEAGKQVEINNQEFSKQNFPAQVQINEMQGDNIQRSEIQENNVEIIRSENSSKKFKVPIQLLKESWYLYRQKIKTLLGITAIPAIFSYLSELLTRYLSSTSLRYSFWFSVIVAILYSISFFLWLWFFPSVIYSLKEDIGLKESYRKGLKIIIPSIWILLLFSALVIGGTLFFVAPGFLFLIWFSLPAFVLVDQGKKGMGALFNSKDLIENKFLGVVGRYLVLLLVALGSGILILISVGSILGLILFFMKFQPIENLISLVITTGLSFASIFIWPFTMVYLFLIYNNLKEIKLEASVKSVDGKLNESLNEELGQSTQKGKLKYIFYIIPGILGTLVIGIIFTIHSLNIFLGRDIRPVNDSDLRLSKVEIPKEENAFYDLKWVSEKLSIPEERLSIREMAEGKKWNSNLVKKLIDSNQETLAYFEKASDRPYFQVPQFQDPKTINMETKLPVKVDETIRDIRDMAYLNLIKAKYLFGQGRQKEAIEMVMKTIKVGQLIQKSPRPSVIDYLVGMAVKRIGLKGLREIIPNLNLPPQVLRNYVAELNQFGTNNDGLDKLSKMGYISRINTKLEIEKTFIKNSGGETEIGLDYFYKPNRTRKMITDYYRGGVKNSDKDCYELSLPKTNFFFDSKLFSSKFVLSHPEIGGFLSLTENSIGKKLLFEMLTLSFPKIFTKRCLTNFSARGTQLLMAIKAYQIDYHRLPVRLDDLVPKYISKIPVDPFSGKSIKYSPQKRIIYTIGPDRKDSGGSQGNDWQKMKDPTFKIEF